MCFFPPCTIFFFVFSPNEQQQTFIIHYKERSCCSPALFSSFWWKFEFQMHVYASFSSSSSSLRVVFLFYRHFPPRLDNDVKHWAVFSYFMWFSSSSSFFRPHAIFVSSTCWIFMELVDDVRECGGGQTCIPVISLYIPSWLSLSLSLRMCCVWWNILGQRCWIAMTTRALGFSFSSLFSARESKVGEKSPRLYRYAPRRQAI